MKKILIIFVIFLLYKVESFSFEKEKYTLRFASYQAALASSFFINDDSYLKMVFDNSSFIFHLYQLIDFEKYSSKISFSYYYSHNLSNTFSDEIHIKIKNCFLNSHNYSFTIFSREVR